MNDNGVSVVVPCYNEQEAIADVVGRLDEVLKAMGRPGEIIVVDDGSTDATAERLRSADCRVIRHPINLGYGAAIKTGVAQARYDTIAITDADGTYPIERIPDLLAALGEAAMAVGARTGASVRIPAIRRPAKWMLGMLANYLTGVKIPDLNSGLRVFRRSLFERFIRFLPNGFSLTTTITLAALSNGYAVQHVPIDYHSRLGASKIRPVRDTIEFVKLILRTILYFDPLRVFVPVSMLLMAASIAVGVGSKLLFGEVMDVSTTVLFVTSLHTLAIGALADLIIKRIQ